MNKKQAQEQQECKAMAREGVSALAIVGGIIDKRRKYVIECRPMYMHGNVPSVACFGRDKYALSSKAAWIFNIARTRKSKACSRPRASLMSTSATRQVCIGESAYDPL